MEEKKVKITVKFSLSREGQKRALVDGRNAGMEQTITMESHSELLLRPETKINNNGEAILDFSGDWDCRAKTLEEGEICKDLSGRLFRRVWGIKNEWIYFEAAPTADELLAILRENDATRIERDAKNVELDAELSRLRTERDEKIRIERENKKGD